MNEKWDRYFLDLALSASRMSRDPSTRVGSLIVRDNRLLSTGFNGFPRGIADDARLHDRETKMKLVVHAKGWVIFCSSIDHYVETTGATKVEAKAVWNRIFSRP